MCSTHYLVTRTQDKLDFRFLNERNTDDETVCVLGLIETCIKVKSFTVGVTMTDRCKT